MATATYYLHMTKEQILDALRNVQEPDLGKDLVKGFMIESFIKGGNQNINKLAPNDVDREGLSITDPCLGWQETEQLLLQIAREI